MSITEKLHSNTELKSYPGEIPCTFLYTAGLAGEDFFRKLKNEGTLLASRCDKCGVTYLPSRVFCERCMSHLPKPIELKPKGEVCSFTECHENMDGTRKAEPLIIAAIKIDGADTTLVHYLSGVKGGEAEIGMKVEAVLKAKKEREGSILDILHFKPVK